MRAYVMTRYGGPAAAELREVPVPQPKAGELRIRVHAAGLNPVDYKIREGQLRVIRRYPLPIVMGNELAGVVETCGPGAKQFAPGDRVFARVDKDALGAFAEYACVPESLVARMPERLDFTAAAAVPLAGLTALQALRDELHAGPGQRLFIPGGAGGVGTFALQLAKRFGTSVATTASPRGEALVRRLGADVIVDYTKEAFETVLKDYDGAFDLVGGDTLTRAFAVVKPGGLVVSIAGTPEPETARKDLGRPGLSPLFWLASLGTRLRGLVRKVRYRYLFMHPSGSDLADLARRVDDGTLEVVIDRIVPFAQIAEAFAHLESGHAKGKIVVRMVD
ncbi:NADP-dependent oxidoreductase [Nannocystis pusilla]|uniref:NADP-dependent oxidoreductase n=1 Tax=Nannocystis pusilla TaxID=889268 RepID=UPI003DA41ED2